MTFAGKFGAGQFPRQLLRRGCDFYIAVRILSFYAMFGRNLKLLRPYVCQSCSRSLKLESRRYATAATPDIYDVVCVGGGPAGLSLLTALRKYGGTITLDYCADSPRVLKSHFASETRVD